MKHTLETLLLFKWLLKTSILGEEEMGNIFYRIPCNERCEKFGEKESTVRLASERALLIVAKCATCLAPVCCCCGCGFSLCGVEVMVKRRCTVGDIKSEVDVEPLMTLSPAGANKSNDSSKRPNRFHLAVETSLPDILEFNPLVKLSDHSWAD